MKAPATAMISAALVLAATCGGRADTPLRGYTAAHAAVQRALEARFADIPSAAAAAADAALLDDGAALADGWRSAGLAVRAIAFDALVVSARSITVSLEPASAHRRPRRHPRGFDLLAAGQQPERPPVDPASPDGAATGASLVLRDGSDADLGSHGPGGVRGTVAIVPAPREAHAVIAARLAAAGAVATIFGGAPDAAPAVRPRSGIPFVSVDAAAMRRVLDAVDDADPGARLHVAVTLIARPRRLRDLEARIDGTSASPPVVIYARRDASAGTVAGGGLAVLAELGRSLGALRDGGWQPLRAILLVSTEDGDEPGSGARALLAHDRGAAAGIAAAVDAGAIGDGTGLVPLASPVLAPLLAACAQDVRDPAIPAASLRALVSARGPIAAKAPAPLPSAFAGAPTARPLFAGPPLAFAGTGVRSGVELTGIVALRLADADTVPYAFGAYLPPLDALVSRLAPFAAAAGLGGDLGRLRRSVDGVRAAARHYERISAEPGRAGAAPDALDAVRSLDGVTAPPRGGDSTAEMRAAFAAGDANKAAAVLARLAATLDRAAADLGGG